MIEFDSRGEVDRAYAGLVVEDVESQAPMEMPSGSILGHVSRSLRCSLDVRFTTRLGGAMSAQPSVSTTQRFAVALPNLLVPPRPTTVNDSPLTCSVVSSDTRAILT
jgi:hypothetical protein